MLFIRSRFRILTLVSGAVLVSVTGAIDAQQPDTANRVIEVTLTPASSVTLPGEVDSNSPAFWDRSGETPTLHVWTSLYHPSLSTGSNVRRLQSAQPVQYDTAIDGGRWIEAVVQDEDGTLYSYYHNEPTEVCWGYGRTAPRIGAARSTDGGRSWQDFGIIMEAAPISFQCTTPNYYFAGGFGDFSAILNRSRTHLYFFISTYARDPALQGVAMARLPWDARNWPLGSLEVWSDGQWAGVEPVFNEDGEIVATQYPDPTPIYPVQRSWHSLNGVDAFWGPSVHWNIAINQYVMLLNRANNHDWGQEGIYVSFAPSVGDPSVWSAPQKLLDGGVWYPQVIGLEPGFGTDKVAGRTARFFMAGISDYLIQFALRPAQ